MNDQGVWGRNTRTIAQCVCVLLGLIVGAEADAREIRSERFEVQLEVTTQIVGSHQEYGERFPATRWLLDLVISMEPIRRFSDGSIGTLLRFEDVRETVSIEDELVAVSESLLMGRVVELRTFEDGEVLDVDQGGHIAGWGRGGEVLDVLLPLLSPAPPKMKWGEKVGRRMIWPFRVGADVRWDNAVLAQWTNEGPIKNLAGPVRRYQYQGPWSLKGLDRRQSPPLRLSASGEARGSLEVTVADGRVLWHEIDWTRTVAVSWGEEGAIAQEQHFVGRMHRVDP
jgi:hypothetical protein